MFDVSMYNVQMITFHTKDVNTPDSDKARLIFISSEKDIFIFVQESMNF